MDASDLALIWDRSNEETRIPLAMVQRRLRDLIRRAGTADGVIQTPEEPMTRGRV
ncbi:MAG: hypothetical protein JO069_14305 [Verrucomicrobia bacterium]|nr:hypothetical protein [Verrucomicrobiota bacterium]